MITADNRDAGAISSKRYVWLSAVPVLLVAGAWAVATYGGFVGPFFLPTPSAVIVSAIQLFRSHGYVNDIVASLARVLVAFGLCAATAVPLGLLMGRSPIITAVLSPFVVVMRYVPISAFIPLLILWAGIGTFQKVLFLWLGTFFYLLALVADATASVAPELIDTAATLGATRPQVLVRVIFPAALPAILDALRVMMGVGWTYLVLAEIVAAESGIGYMIMESQRFLKTPRVFVGILTVGAIGLGLDFLLRSTRDLLLPWART